MQAVFFHAHLKLSNSLLPPVGIYKNKTLEFFGKSLYDLSRLAVVVIAVAGDSPFHADLVKMPDKFRRFNRVLLRRLADDPQKTVATLGLINRINFLHRESYLCSNSRPVGLFVAPVKRVQTHGAQHIGQRFRPHGHIQTQINDFSHVSNISCLFKFCLRSILTIVKIHDFLTIVNILL